MVTTYLDSPGFWSSLFQVIAVDVALAADNAVVVALACRNLPPHLRTRGIVLGLAAAIALRIVLTLFAATLLAVPALKLVGAALLLWIGLRLVRPGAHDQDLAVEGRERLAGAVRTVVVADVVMSVDNVLAVAAAAKGSAATIMLGLPVSMALMVLASRVVLSLLHRAPWIVILGGGLIGWIAMRLAVGDPLAAAWIDARLAWLPDVAPALGAVLVMAVGLVPARRAAPGRGR